MTDSQEEFYIKLRRKLRNRGIKEVPTLNKVKKFSVSNQKVFMLIKVLSEEVKNMDAWEHSSAFRQNCFNKYGVNFNILKQAEKEIENVLKYVKS